MPGNHRSKSITRSPKLYFTDTGVLLSLLGVRQLDDLLASPLLGGIWETFVFAELRRRQLGTAGSWSLHFFRDRGDEVDFLIHRGGRFELLEARWTQSPAPRDTAPFGRVARHLGTESIIRSTVICGAPSPYPRGRR